ncbi:putative tRNA-dihydrouridine synthase [Lachnospiraceae bacterium]|jgi:tRNA-dihydrouridine synthase B|nr:tRNA-dihydrouridine synthase family protein [Lachnospiraceae bacterium]GFI66223.1 putative tRNA-dihydrouridine synthase [Lachnospiraceae bacterium]
MEIKQIRLGGLLLSSNVLMAPLAGYTCYPFRMLAYEMGAGLCFTEMSSANALKYQDRATRRLLFTTPEEPVKAVQLLGGIPAVMEQMACGELLAGFDIIDINMGCPVPNVFKSGEGSALMLDRKRAAAIIRGCKKSGKPVTVKCRTGIHDNDMFTAEFARMCEAAGADMITIHGRSRNMMYDGTPCYREIAQAKAAVSIPVIANGGIWSAQDAEEMMERTGADGIMLARYALENPFLFSELTGTGCRKTRLQILLEQAELAGRYYDETFVMAYIRKLAAYGMKKRKGTKKYKEQLYKSGSMDELKEVVRKIFS